jgi:replicative DNA helicase
LQKDDEKNELQLLSFIWQNQQVLPVAMTEMSEEHFVKYRNIFATLKEAYNSIKGHLNERVIDLPLEMSYTLNEEDYSANVDDAVSAYNFLAKKVFNNYKRRTVANLLSSTADGIGNDVDINELISKMSKSTSELSALGQSNINQGEISNEAEDRFKQYQEIKKHPEKLNIVKTGFKAIDESNGGFSRGELVYVIGRKGDGKSVLLLNFAYHMWRNGQNVILYSLEISKNDYMRRFDSRAALISSRGLKLGTLTETEEERYRQYQENLKKHLSLTGKPVGNFVVVDVPGKCTPAFISAKTEELEQKMNITFDCIISEYAQIMEPDVKTDVKRDNLGAIALGLKHIARNKNKIVISAAQMTRAGKSETQAKNGHAGTEHVAESDQISDHLDWGIAIRSVSDNTGIIESFKIRDGEPFEFHFEKHYDKMNIIEQSKDEWDEALKKNVQSD